MVHRSTIPSKERRKRSTALIPFWSGYRYSAVHILRIYSMRKITTVTASMPLKMEVYCKDIKCPAYEIISFTDLYNIKNTFFSFFTNKSKHIEFICPALSISPEITLLAHGECTLYRILPDMT